MGWTVFLQHIFTLLQFFVVSVMRFIFPFVFLSFPLTQVLSIWVSWHFCSQLSSSICITCLYQLTLLSCTFLYNFSQLICAVIFLLTKIIHSIEHACFISFQPSYSFCSCFLIMQHCTLNMNIINSTLDLQKESFVVSQKLSELFWSCCFSDYHAFKHLFHC